MSSKYNLEQFQEAARDAIDLAFWSWNENGKSEKDAISMAVSLVTEAATSLVEAVIGEDDYPSFKNGVVVDEHGNKADSNWTSSNMSEHAIFKTGANELRASQRAKLKEQS